MLAFAASPAPVAAEATGREPTDAEVADALAVMLALTLPLGGIHARTAAPDAHAQGAAAHDHMKRKADTLASLHGMRTL